MRKLLAKLIYPAIFKRYDKLKKLGKADLARCNLKLFPHFYKYKELSPQYQSIEYLRLANGLIANKMLIAECDRIIKEQIFWIAEKSMDRNSEMLARGTINGVSLLKERLLDYKIQADEIDNNK